MTTTTNATIERPDWSDPALDFAPDEQHPDDQGVWIKSQPVDSWTVVDEQDGRTFAANEPVQVYLDGFRHYAGRHLDWPDSVRVEGDTDPGGDGTMMRLATARRLAAALTAAADLLEGQPAAEEPPKHEECDRLPCDKAYQHGTHLAGWHNVNWMRASELGIEVSANAIEDAPWATRVRMGDAEEILEPDEVTRLVTALLNANGAAMQANIENQLNMVRLLEADLRDAKRGQR